MNAQSLILITSFLLIFPCLQNDGMAKELVPPDEIPPPTTESPASETKESGTAEIKVKISAKDTTLGPVMTERKPIRDVIKGDKKKIRDCYESGLTKTPKLEGRMTLSFTIEMDGRVSAPKIKKSDLANPEVEQCIVALSKTWKFPKREASTTVHYPFIFNKE